MIPPRRLHNDIHPKFQALRPWHPPCYRGGRQRRFSRGARMKTHYSWTALFALCVAAQAAAQTDYSRRDRDRRSHRSNRSEACSCTWKTSGCLTETAADGRFNLTVPQGRQTIVASVIGYALLRTDVDVAAMPLDMTIRLSEGAGAYAERVTVSGSLRGESDSVPGSTSLYQPRDRKPAGRGARRSGARDTGLAVGHGDRRLL